MVNPARHSPIPLVTLALILAIGGWIRLVILAGDWLWVDELHTSWATHGKFSDVAARAADGNQSPIFFWLTWIPVYLFGESPITIRAISFLSGLGVMVLAPLTCWKTTRSWIATLTIAFLIAFILNPFIYYATESRPYSLLQLLGLIQIILFYSAVGHRVERRVPLIRWLILACVSASLVYVHLTAIWIFAAELIFVLAIFLFSTSHRAAIQKSTGSILLAIVAMACLCIPAGNQMLDVMERKENWDGISTIAQFWSFQRITFLGQIVIPILGLLLLSRIDSKNERPSPEPQTECCADSFVFGGLILLWAIVPTTCILMLSWLEIAPIAMQRYVQVGALAFPLLAGFAIGQLSTKRSRLILAAVVIGFGIWQTPNLWVSLSRGYIPVLRFENWQSPADAIRLNAEKQNHPLFLFGNLVEDESAFTNDSSRFQQYLEFPIRGMYDFDISNRNTIVYPTTRFSGFKTDHLTEIKSQGGAWILIRAHSPLVDEITADLKRKFLERGDDIRISNVVKRPDSYVYLISVDDITK